MKRRAALASVSDGLSDTEVVITTVGLISRDFYEVADSERVFYMAGSMGMASSIGIGIAVNKPDTEVVVIDGDGSLLNNFGTLVTLGYHSPDNVTHIVLDNNAYASCSREPTMADSVDLAAMAETAGYDSTIVVDSEAGVTNAVADRPDGGPYFVHALIETGGQRHPARILDLPHYKNRLTDYLSTVA